MSGVGMFGVAKLNEALDLDVNLVGRDGAPSQAELEAIDLVAQEPRCNSLEMRASLLEQLAALVPVRCSDCGAEADVTALARALRKGMVLS